MIRAKKVTYVRVDLLVDVYADFTEGSTLKTWGGGNTCFVENSIRSRYVQIILSINSSTCVTTNVATLGK